MFILSLLTWWYGPGFKTRAQGVGRSLARSADNFSIGLLLKTLFNPFRQIDAGATGKGPSAFFQAMLSRLISRTVGFVARTILIIVGIVFLSVQSVISVVIIAAHLALPLAPIIGIYLAANLPELHLW